MKSVYLYHCQFHRKMSLRGTGFFQLAVSVCLLTATTVFAQTEEPQKAPMSIEIPKSVDGNEEENLAKNYEKLAQQFNLKENYPKAEEYLKKALSSYKKLGQKEAIARVSRSLAKVQEKLNKKNEAQVNYSVASKSYASGAEKEINLQDANRVSYNSTFQTKSSSVNSNISTFKKLKRTTDLQDAYIQKAELQLFQNDPAGAIATYEEAILDAGSDWKQVVLLKDRIAAVYAGQEQFDKAIALHNELLQDAERVGDVTVQIGQLRSLSHIYFAIEASEQAVSLLKKAYELALRKSHTKEAKACLNELLNYYRTTGNPEESLALCRQFLQRLDFLVRTDSSLMDMNTLHVIETRIRQLEKEKDLKDRLIAKTNTFNYFLLGSIGVLLLLLALFIRSLRSIKKKNKRIALQSLRREMNPHFIFNSLNSVNQFIAQNNELEANKYLTSYSNLMRTTMENSGKDFIPLGKEVELLKKYLELELMRFEDKFEFVITVDERLDMEASYIPNMLIQPSLENAIWHGLRYREGKGLLLLRFEQENSHIRITIDDDGIGMAKSAELKTRNQKKYESLGLKNTQQRITLLNNLYRKDISFQMIEKLLPDQGTVVEMAFPLMDKLPG